MSVSFTKINCTFTFIDFAPEIFHMFAKNLDCQSMVRLSSICKVVKQALQDPLLKIYLLENGRESLSKKIKLVNSMGICPNILKINLTYVFSLINEKEKKRNETEMKIRELKPKLSNLQGYSHLSHYGITNYSPSVELLRRHRELQLVSLNATLAGLDSESDQSSTFLDLLQKIFHAFPNVKELNLSNAPIEDKNLIDLYKLKHLTKLDLTGCNAITAVGIACLQKNLPSCQIINPS